MPTESTALWERVQITQTKWALPPLVNLGGGFWTVDIEDGFHVSRYRNNGTFDEYLCSQDELSPALRNLVLASEAATAGLSRKIS
jgi:hypothetical protein